MPSGTLITLQQQVDTRGWVNLPASVYTDARSSYDMRVVLGVKGHNQLRLVDSRMQVVSPFRPPALGFDPLFQVTGSGNSSKACGCCSQTAPVDRMSKGSPNSAAARPGQRLIG
ncbi:hypothetical protein [Streptomyces sp. NPDC004546]|uniref:hypothetical protein n=1 Tax=Streptomyces sp. NPDC004546 TaxID=3154282 RepID=UPI0033B0BC25